MVEYLEGAGELKRIADFHFHRSAIHRLEEAVVRCAREHGEVKIPMIRDEFSTTRKYLIPLMEYLDDAGITRREGDRRFLVRGP